MRIRDHGARKYAAHEGFTMFETAVVVAIIGILVIIAMASYAVTVAASRRIVCQQNLRTLNNASAQYLSTSGALPPDLAALEPHVRGFDTIKYDPGTTTLLSYDPATGKVTCPNHPE